MALFDNSVSVYSTSVDDHKIQFYKIIIKNFVGTNNCSPEPEFIEEIVEVIWKRLKGESSSVQSRRQIDNPGAGEDSSIIISQNDASSFQNASAEWSRFFFFALIYTFYPLGSRTSLGY